MTLYKIPRNSSHLPVAGQVLKASVMLHPRPRGNSSTWTWKPESYLERVEGWWWENFRAVIAWTACGSLLGGVIWYTLTVVWVGP